MSYKEIYNYNHKLVLISLIEKGNNFSNNNLNKRVSFFSTLLNSNLRFI